MTSTTPPDIAAHAESLIPQFTPTRLLNADQAGRRISLLGTIHEQPAILLAERAAFPTDTHHLTTFPSTLTKIKNLGANDIYKQHVKKYSKQGLRLVTETPHIYTTYIHPYMRSKREQGRLNWVFNILEGRTEQEDVMYREPSTTSTSTCTPSEDEGFLLLPDLNWDRKTVGSLHLLGLVERRDIWSVRDLKKKHVAWVKHMRERLLDAAVKLYPELDRDQLKLYVHYQPTYYHFHIHIVHVELEAGSTQATGKALGLENIISQLETMAGGEEAGMADVSLTYHLGEQSELWEKIYLPLKEGREPEFEA